MSLPPEVLDHVFSYLHSDIATLKTCSLSHPFLSQLVERYLYATITLYSSQDYDSDDDTSYAPQPFKFNQLLSNTPKIGNYVQTVNVVISSGPHAHATELAEISYVLQNLFSLKVVKMTPPPYQQLLWGVLPDLFRQAFLKCLSLPSINELWLARVKDFPFSKTTTIKKLSLDDCWDDSQPKFVLDYPLEYLSITKSGRAFFRQLIPQAENCKLRSVAFLGRYERYDFGPISQCLASCSNSLTTLHVDIGYLFSSNYDLSRGTIGTYVENNIPISLSTLVHLKDLTISADVDFVHIEKIYGPTWTMTSSIPAITDLLKTTSSIQHLTLKFRFGIARSVVVLPRVDWSTLVHLLLNSSASSSRLDISWQMRNGLRRQLTLDDFLTSFSSCAKLMKMVKQGTLVITLQEPVDVPLPSFLDE